MELSELAERVVRLAERVAAIETQQTATQRTAAQQTAAPLSDTPPWQMDEVRLQELMDELHTGVKRDPTAALRFDAPSTGCYLSAHARNVSRVAMLIARKHGFSDASVRAVGLCGLLHDAGMESLPHGLLEAGRPLTPDEFRQVRLHPVNGADLVRERYRFGGLLDSVIPLTIEQHHERADGSGYPHGLPAARIHDFARVLSVADSFEAMTTPRPFRAARHPAQAMRSLLLQGCKTARGGMYDRDVLKTFVWAASLYPLGCEVELSDGRRARVTEATDDPKRPVVKTSGRDGETIDLTRTASLTVKE